MGEFTCKQKKVNMSLSQYKQAQRWMLEGWNVWKQDNRKIDSGDAKQQKMDYL